MPGFGTATVTGKAGPGLTATAITLTNITRMEYDFYGLVYRFFTLNDGIKEFDYADITTITMTVSGLTTTITTTNV
jgi:hypothetical protein